VLRRPVRFVEPAFEPLPRRLPAAPDIENTSIWAGAQVSAPAGDPLRWVEGTWNVPNVYPPADAEDGLWYSASTWVGLDRIGSPSGIPDIIQAGCDSNAMRSGGQIQRQVKPWWEWFTGDTFWITTFAVSQGDTLSCLICMEPGSTDQALITLYNVTSNIAVRFEITRPPQVVPFTGSSAEWIVEAFQINDSFVPVARFGEVFFDNAYAGTLGNALLGPGSGNTINMLGAPNQTIAEGLIETDNLVQVRYTG